jgi:small conductance mechanosensitive channel
MLFGKASELIANRLNIWYEGFLNNLPNIIAAIFILIFFYLLANFLKNYFYSLSGKFIKKRSLKNFSTSFLQSLIIVVGVMIALSILNLDKVVTSMLAGAGVAGLILGFAMQDIISNYFSGVTISLTDPFGLGDLVELDGEIGIVERIEIRSTVIRTPDGQLLEIPNKDVINNQIFNYTVTGERRIEIRSGISYDSDRKKAKELALEVVSKIEGVAKDKPIEFYYEEFGPSSLNFVLRFWMEFGNSQKDFMDLQSEAITKLLEVYDENAIEMPYPTTSVQLEKKN